MDGDKPRQAPSQAGRRVRSRSIDASLDFNGFVAAGIDDALVFALQCGGKPARLSKSVRCGKTLVSFR